MGSSSSALPLTGDSGTGGGVGLVSPREPICRVAWGTTGESMRALEPDTKLVLSPRPEKELFEGFYGERVLLRPKLECFCITSTGVSPVSCSSAGGDVSVTRN